jgi:UDP-N-acetylglucosamine 1-carboxyvinyltransferase
MELANTLRGSSYLLGAEFGRFGKASVPHPGGCSIGARPLDLHMKAFEALGADCVHKNGRLEVESEDGRPHGSSIYFDKVSVGATVNAILASVLADGVTTWEAYTCYYAVRIFGSSHYGKSAISS